MIYWAIRISFHSALQSDAKQLPINMKCKHCTGMKTESITPEERTKGSDRCREDNQGGDGGECHVEEVRKTMVTGMIISSLMT